MPYPKLRIAWSIFWGVLSLLLVLLWARSYSQWDDLTCHVASEYYVGCDSIRGRLSPEFFTGSGPGTFIAQPVPPREIVELLRPRHENLLGFGYTRSITESAVTFPHWLPVLISAALAAGPWIRRRFSLRTLLATITLAAAILGLITYAYRSAN
jgi:hypothetical protein